MKVEYKFAVGTPIQVIYELKGFGLINNRMYIRSINIKINNKDLILEYELGDMFVNMNVLENCIDTNEPVVHNNCKLLFYSDKKYMSDEIKELLKRS